MSEQPVKNTDKEIWREDPDNHYAPSVHITANNEIGINVGGTVVVMTPEAWVDFYMQNQKLLNKTTMTLSEFRSKYPNSSVTSHFVTYVEDQFIVSAQLAKSGEIHSTGTGSGKTVEEAEDKAIQRALEHLG